MKTINVTQYGAPHPADQHIRYFLDAEQAKKTAEAVGLKEALLAGPVDVVIPGSTDKGYWGSLTRPNIKEGWMKAFFGPVAREIGIDLVFKNLSINGEKLKRDNWRRGLLGDVQKYLLSEEKRLAKDANEKARKTGNTMWSAPGQLLVPDIGTVVRLTEDWTFRLYTERRNDKLLKAIGKRITGWDEDLNYWLVVIPAGTDLVVDRVYIRKGANEFSSFTFNLHKGSSIVFNGDTIKAFGRFWAKLSDVNQMKVQIDMKTLAEN